MVGLVFTLVLTEQNDPGINRLFISLQSLWGFFGGLLIGVFVIATGNYMKGIDEDLLPTLFTLFLSLIAVFILYSIMQFKLGDLNYFLMGIIVGGATIVILKGIPQVIIAHNFNPWTVRGQEHHEDIAKEYLSREVGLTTNEVEQIIANTGLFPKLRAGNFVFNYYMDGVYLTTVTRGRASVTPYEALSGEDSDRLAEGLDDASRVSDDESSEFQRSGI
jgi:membrane protein YdbS with pleckstrin-like domain